METIQPAEPSYIVEKLYIAVRCLVVSNKKAQDRLYNAYSACHQLLPSDFPPGDVRDRWEGIVKFLHSKPSPYLKGTEVSDVVKETLRSVQSNQCLRYLDDLWELYHWAIDQEMDQRLSRM